MPVLSTTSAYHLIAKQKQKCVKTASHRFPKLLSHYHYTQYELPPTVGLPGNAWWISEHFVYGCPPLCCRVPVELMKCCLLTRPSPSSPESSTALSKNISKPSTSEFWTHYNTAHLPEMKYANLQESSLIFTSTLWKYYSIYINRYVCFPSPKQNYNNGERNGLTSWSLCSNAGYNG